MKARIRQEIVLSETRIKGSYRYGEIFQMRPMHQEAPVLEWAMGHHPWLLEYMYNVPDVSETKYNPDLPDHVLMPMLDDEASSKVRKWILLVLSIFAKSRVFQYASGMSQQQWFMRLPKDSNDLIVSPTPLWGQGGYQYQGISAWIIDKFSDPKVPPIQLVESNEYYRTETPQQYVVGQTSDNFELPDRINSYLDTYIALPERFKNCFLSSCFLFNQGIQLFYQAPSLAFAACVSSLETLIAVDKKEEPKDRCECCDQIKYHVRQKFLDFIRKYGSDSKDARRVADRVYERRSRILHEGQLFVGEAEPKTIEGAIDWINDDQSRRNVIRFFRTCIINWLISNKNAQRAL
jgi:hypothetical protein